MMRLSYKSKTHERGTSTFRSRFLPLGLMLGPVGGIIQAIFGNWKIVIVGLLIAVVLYQNTVSVEFLKFAGVRTVPGLQQEIQQLTDNTKVLKEHLVECNAGRDRLKEEIKTTNAQVQKWASLSNKLKQEQMSLKQQLADSSKKTDVEVNEILKGPIPQTCEGAIKLLRDAATKGELKW